MVSFCLSCCVTCLPDRGRRRPGTMPRVEALTLMCGATGSVSGKIVEDGSDKPVPEAPSHQRGPRGGREAEGIPTTSGPATMDPRIQPLGRRHFDAWSDRGLRLDLGRSQLRPAKGNVSTDVHRSREGPRPQRGLTSLQPSAPRRRRRDGAGFYPRPPTFETLMAECRDLELGGSSLQTVAHPASTGRRRSLEARRRSASGSRVVRRSMKRPPR